MASSSTTAAPRRKPKFEGLFHDETATDSYWIRECGMLRLPPLEGVGRIVVSGEILPHEPAEPTSARTPGLRVELDGISVARLDPSQPGPFRLEIPVPARPDTTDRTLALHLTGVVGSNALAWLGRVLPLGFLQPWRRQLANRRLRIRTIQADLETLFDFGNRASPWNPAFARRHLKVGMNITGFFRADLGVGESARCMARAADASGIPLALVDLKLPCKNSLSDREFAARLGDRIPHPVTVFHLDPPAARDIDHHHGREFRRGKHNIGYWAWELPEFPDAWSCFADYFDEIWAPSRFAAEAIAEKVPVPVLAMPHSISLERPQGNLRASFGLPEDRFLFLFLFDLNSYAERKNPAAVIDAFRRSGLASKGASLVIKVHSTKGNEADVKRLEQATADLASTTLIVETLPRRRLTQLQAACDCFVSLHRSEGFGLSVAECMFLGKPVISTDWSATTEYVNASNGCPVRARTVVLDRNHGPYAKGQRWAEPDVDDAAAWMRRVHGDDAFRERIGRAGRATIEELFSPQAIGARYRRRLEAIAAW